jgi:NAD+ synthase (glutamine-hydrolysing)
MSRTLKIAGACLNQTPIDWENNTANILAAIRDAQKTGADILCLPELCISGYGCEDLFLADWLSEVCLQKLQSIQQYCDNITVCVGIPLRIKSNTYNGVCVIRNKQILGITLKQFLARDGVHYEPRWFEPWPSNKQIQLKINNQDVPVGDVVYELKGVSFGFEICEDAWRVNRPGINLHKRKTDLILNPSASHFGFAKNYEREKLVIESSSKFNCTYLYVNHLGNEAGRMIYDGDILIAQQGKLLGNNKRLSFQGHNLLSLNIDFDIPDASEINLTDTPISKFEEFAQAASLGLFDYLRKSKAKGFVLSLSGGADSSCCAVLVAEMIKRAGEELGWDTFCKKLNLDVDASNQNPAYITAQLLSCAYQSSENSSTKTFEAAQNLAEFISARFYNWSVIEEIKSYTEKIEKALERKLNWQTDDIALQNIQARSRSPIIWMLANINAALLITTSNRSEGDVGYATMDGDTSGSLALIAGVDKRFILHWLKWAESSLGYKALSIVNQLTPSAELRPQSYEQFDEVDLMPYDTLVQIERQAIYYRQSPLQVFEALRTDHKDTSLLKSHIIKFFKLWSANQWKRERTAPSFHYDDLNVDPRSWCRFPILSGSYREEIAILEKAN